MSPMSASDLEANFHPSDVMVFARSPFPFVDTFHRSEIEIAAGMLVAAMVHHGDEWAPMLPKQISEWLEAEQRKPESHWAKLFANTSFEPDFDDLIEDSWGCWIGDETEGRRRPIALTQTALDRIREKGLIRGRSSE